MVLPITSARHDQKPIWRGGAWISCVIEERLRTAARGWQCARRRLTAPRWFEGSLMRAFLFPGQGSQAVGMGAALADASRAARDTFEQVDEALGQNLFRLMREGPEDELKLTENAQPAIMANSYAVLRTLGVSLSSAADFVAGHSL